jgi:hypothetical protein
LAVPKRALDNRIETSLIGQGNEMKQWQQAGLQGLSGGLNVQYTPTVTTSGSSHSQSYMASAVLHQ